MKATRSVIFIFLILMIAGSRQGILADILLQKPSGSSSCMKAEPKKYALIIAIAAYDETATGWTRINADKDAELLVKVLRKQGFSKENIMVLKDSLATRSGIRVAMQILKAKAGPGDQVLVHYSGHGQQIADDNGDEADGYDEALIPFDAGKYFVRGQYEGQNHLRDDEMMELLSGIRERLGPAGSLLVVLDACHSGTATRGDGIMRGSTTPFRPDENLITGLTGKEPLFGDYTEAENLSPMTVFSASAAHQNNYEYTLSDGSSMGSLTYAFCKSIEQLSSAGSYRSLYNQIRLTFATIRPQQQPQAEGDLDQLLFGETLAKLPGCFFVNQVLSDTTLILNHGELSGLTENTTVGFFPAETRDFQQATPLVTGKVTEAGMTASWVTLDKSTATQRIADAWCYILQQDYGSLNLSLKISKLTPLPIASEIRIQAARHPFIRFTEHQQSVTLAADTLEKILKLVASDGALLLEIPSYAAKTPQAVAGEVTDRLWMYARASYLRGLEASDQNLNISLDILSQKVNLTPATGQDSTSAKGSPEAAALPAFSTGDTIRVKITNLGAIPAYINLLDIQPDNQVNVLLPGSAARGKTIHDLRIEPGYSYTSDPFVVAAPFGLEVFKCIATSTPVDLREAFSPRGIPATRSGDTHPLEQLFIRKPAGMALTRGQASLPASSTFTLTTLFTIHP